MNENDEDVHVILLVYAVIFAVVVVAAGFQGALPSYCIISQAVLTHTNSSKGGLCLFRSWGLIIIIIVICAKSVRRLV